MESGEACTGCVWDNEVDDPIIYKLFDYLALQSAGAPIERHELTNEEWRAMGAVKNEMERLAAEEVKEKAKANG